jgi:hypothetical protein
MKYAEYRNSIKTGDILAWGKKSTASSIVRLFTGSEYSHVGMAYVYKGRVFVLEAVFPYIRFVPLSNLLPFYVLHMEQRLNLDAEDFAFSLVGRGTYSIPEAIKSYFGLNKLNNQWQCVEYVKEILKYNLTQINCQDTPSDLILALQKLGKRLVYVDK